MLVVHNLGNIVNVPELKKASSKLLIVEDNCEGLFGKYNGQYSGTQSLISSVSFLEIKLLPVEKVEQFLLRMSLCSNTLNSVGVKVSPV